MLINLRNALMAGKRLPYDADVEYLESTGTQYINTGVLASAALNDAQIDITYSSSSTSGDLYIFGGGATFNTAIQCVINSSSNYFQPSWGQSLAIAGGYAANAVATLRMTYNDYALTFGTTTRTGAFTATSRTFDGRAIYLFRGNRTSGGINTKPVRIYAFKISRNGIPILDLVPVRVGTVGYLYDRVSGKLFGNAGTGDFVLGPDVVPVEYIESHGTEWIDTGVKDVTGNSALSVTFQYTGGQSSACIFGQAYGQNGNLVQMYTSSRIESYTSGGMTALTSTDLYNRHQFSISADGIYFDGNFITSKKLATRSESMCIFSASGGANRSRSRVFDFSLATSASIRFLPVRIGTGSAWEGAMMDTLTRRIYRNAGTGAFTYGNDLKYPIPAS